LNVGRIILGTVLTLLTFAALGPPIGAITGLLPLLLIPGDGLWTAGSRPILDFVGNFLLAMAASMLFSYMYVKTAQFCGLVASVVRLVIPRTDLQIGITTLAGVALGIHQTLTDTAKPSSAHLPSEYLWTIAICAVPAFACAWISRPRPLPTLPELGPMV
jgi:hypothetical protein